MLGASRVEGCVPRSLAAARLRRHGAGKCEQAASALQGCTSDIRRLLTLPPDFCWCESGTFCNNPSSKNCIRGNNPCSVGTAPQQWRARPPHSTFLRPALPGVDAVLDIRHPGMLLQGVDGLQDVLGPVLHLQAIRDSVRLCWGPAIHPGAKHTL